MLTIRLQRTGRSRHAQFRVIVQDSRFSPVRGRVTAYIGSYDPHTKTAQIDSEKAAKYLQNGAQPSDRVARLLQKEGIKLPDWVSLSEPKSRTVRNPDKRRSTRPAAPEAPVAEAPTEEAVPESAAPENAAEPEAPAETPVAEEPAAESAAETQTTEEPAETTEAPAAEAPAK